MIIELVADKYLLYIVNKSQCNLCTMCSFFNDLFTVTGNNNTIYSKDRIGNKNFQSKLLIIVFQIDSISLIESEEFTENLDCIAGNCIQTAEKLRQLGTCDRSKYHFIWGTWMRFLCWLNFVTNRCSLSWCYFLSCLFFFCGSWLNILLL